MENCLSSIYNFIVRLFTTFQAIIVHIAGNYICFAQLFYAFLCVFFVSTCFAKGLARHLFFALHLSF